MMLQIYTDAPTAHHFRRKRTKAIILLARGLTWYLVQLLTIRLTSCGVVAVEPFCHYVVDASCTHLLPSLW